MPIRNWTVVYLITVVLAVMAAGCLGERTAAPASEPLPSLLLDYHRAGGIAGIDDRLVVFDNGVAVISTRAVSHEFFVNRSELERLDRIFVQAGYTTLQENYTSAFGGADFIRYSITYQNKSVVTEDTVIPFSLQPVIRELNAFLSTHSYQDKVSGSLANIKI